MRDAGELLKQKLTTIREANKTKKNPEIEKVLEETKPLQNVFLRSAERRVNLPPKEETVSVMKELSDVWKKFGIGVTKGVSEKELGELNWV